MRVVVAASAEFGAILHVPQCSPLLSLSLSTSPPHSRIYLYRIRSGVYARTNALPRGSPLAHM